MQKFRTITAPPFSADRTVDDISVSGEREGYHAEYPPLSGPAFFARTDAKYVVPCVNVSKSCEESVVPNTLLLVPPSGVSPKVYSET